MGYKEDLKIDKFSLDEELQNQASLFMQYVQDFAESVFDRDKVKQQLELEYAEIDEKIRKNPDLFGIDKVTETAIRSAILKEETYKEKQNEYFEAVKRANVLGGAKEAFSQRKSMLEHLVKLELAGYFAEPAVSKEVDEKAERKESEKVRKKLRGRRRRKT